jgi:hypothetical protein
MSTYSPSGDLLAEFAAERGLHARAGPQLLNGAAPLFVVSLKPLDFCADANKQRDYFASRVAACNESHRS